MPGDTYTFSLAAENRYGWSEFGEPSVQFRCPAGVPERIERPKVVNITQTSMTLEWKFPFHGGNNIFRFIIQYKGERFDKYENSPRIVVPNIFESPKGESFNSYSSSSARNIQAKCTYTIDCLRSNYTYKFVVAAENNYGVSEFSIPSYSRETLST